MKLEGRASGRSGANKESKLSWMLKVPRQKSKGVPKEGASLSKEGGVGNITLESIMTDLTGTCCELSLLLNLSFKWILLLCSQVLP